MLTLPKIVERSAQPYVAIRQQVRMPFGEAVDRAFPEVFGWLEANGMRPAGAPFIKYNVIQMPRLELEFGVPVEAASKSDGRVLAGTLPGGRYATLTYWGAYDNLMDVNAVLIGWAKEKGIRWDAVETPNGDRFAGRLEIYETDPREEPDQSKWKTEVAIRLADQ